MHEEQKIHWRAIRNSLKHTGGVRANKSNCVLVEADSRTVLSKLPSDSVDCIITSPPYAGLKDYGTTDQIGFGQHREEEYLPDLRNILVELFRVAKSGAALWMVLDTLKEAGETVPLPWEVITRARLAGWTFQDLVIWDKGKSLPWSNPGRFRGVCEYILLFGKGKLTNFNIDAVRDADHLSSYWVKYPERYHPDGKAPSDLWHFPIPTQGSWSKGQTRHHCPFPVSLVARMISITTKTGDTVLDPFSGTGSVIAVASYLGRCGLGIEINPSFVKEFNESGFELLKHRAQVELPRTNIVGSSIRQLIIDLRMLKYAKTLYAGISRGDILNGTARESVGALLLESAHRTEYKDVDSMIPSDLGRIELRVLLRRGADKEAVARAVRQRLSVAPLTIFGIQANVKITSFDHWSKTSKSLVADESWYIYRKGRCHNYDAEVLGSELISALRTEVNDIRRKIPSIVSQLKLTLENPVND